ncbi:hypothetical protein KM043_017312 [Ampulex compressa]|nr:hypothetical protein KM043_017312 [Ampulex compressa]
MIESSTEEATEKFYAEVLRTWYNITDGEKWYNGKDISPADTKLWTNYLDDIRKNWIVWKYKSNMSYVLDAPEVTDPSMGQAKAIRNIFSNKKNGFFIECGAYDGETRSNTLVFERFYGWSGLLIEADPLNFSKMLQKNRKAYLSPTCLSIQPRPVVASFLMANNIGRLHEPENTTLENTHDVAHTGVHVKVQCFPLIHYLAALGVTVVDYFSLDVEGNEIDVLETIPFEQVDIKALSVEFSHNVKGRKYLITLMESKGYYVYSFVQRSDHLANDVIFVKRDT